MKSLISRNALNLTILVSGLAIANALAIDSASAEVKKSYDERQRDEINRRMDLDRQKTPTSGSTNAGESMTNKGGDLLGGILYYFNIGPSVQSSNGLTQFGLQTKLGVGNITGRSNIYFGGAGTSLNGAVTYSIVDPNKRPMFNPFIGMGLGFKNIQNAANPNGDNNAFAAFATGGVDWMLFDAVALSTTVNVPVNNTDTYGTEIQVGASFAF